MHIPLRMRTPLKKNIDARGCLGISHRDAKRLFDAVLTLDDDCKSSRRPPDIGLESPNAFLERMAHRFSFSDEYPDAAKRVDDAADAEVRDRRSLGGYAPPPRERIVSRLKKYLASAPLDKAAGVDGMDGQQVRWASESASFLELTADLVTRIFSTGIWPDAWKVALIVPIPKTMRRNTEAAVLVGNDMEVIPCASSVYVRTGKMDQIGKGFETLVPAVPELGCADQSSIVCSWRVILAEFYRKHLGFMPMWAACRFFRCMVLLQRLSSKVCPVSSDSVRKMN